MLQSVNLAVSSKLTQAVADMNSRGDNMQQTKRANDAVVTSPKPTPVDKSSAKWLQERLAEVKKAIDNQSPATRANLSGRFKVG